MMYRLHTTYGHTVQISHDRRGLIYIRQISKIQGSLATEFRFRSTGGRGPVCVLVCILCLCVVAKTACEQEMF